MDLNLVLHCARLEYARRGDKRRIIAVLQFMQMHTYPQFVI